LVKYFTLHNYAEETRVLSTRVSALYLMSPFAFQSSHGLIFQLSFKFNFYKLQFHFSYFFVWVDTTHYMRADIG